MNLPYEAMIGQLLLCTDKSHVVANRGYQAFAYVVSMKQRYKGVSNTKIDTEYGERKRRYIVFFSTS